MILLYITNCNVLGKELILGSCLADKSGAFLRDAQIMEPVKEHASNPENGRKLWKLSEEIVGEKFEVQ